MQEETVEYIRIKIVLDYVADQCASNADEVNYKHVRKRIKYNKLNNAENCVSDQVNAGVYIEDIQEKLTKMSRPKRIQTDR